MNTKGAGIDNKVPDINNLANKLLSLKVTEIEHKMPDTTGFTNTSEFNRLKKKKTDARIKESTKRLASKSKADPSYDTADENREYAKNFKRLI